MALMDFVKQHFSYMPDPLARVGFGLIFDSQAMMSGLGTGRGAPTHLITTESEAHRVSLASGCTGY